MQLAMALTVGESALKNHVLKYSYCEKALTIDSLRVVQTMCNLKQYLF